MLEIKPIETQEEQIDILGRCHISYKETLFAYKAYDGASLLGAAQFDIRGSIAVLDAIRQAEGTIEDFEGMFILSRAVLNFLDLCGVQEVFSYTVDKEEQHLLRCVGFKETDDILKISLAGLFDSHCEGHCENAL